VTTLVSIVHSVAMITAGGLAAWMVYRYLGLKLVSQSWFNLDAIWAFSLILVGSSLAFDRHGRLALKARHVRRPPDAPRHPRVWE
jgi:hypothetical protein